MSLAKERLAAAAGSVKKSDPMFSVPDMRATVLWHESIGFTAVDLYEQDNPQVRRSGKARSICLRSAIQRRSS